MVRTIRIAIAGILLLLAGNAAALGLGQIEVKSKRNQPLLAEIPIISTTPGELEALQARLASPETFRRVGLSPPTGIAADLQFSLGSDARGRPVIRVTTLQPVDQAVLNFLIEVDWGQGRLVREYSALVDAPATTSAPLQPAVAAPVIQAPNVVHRPATAAPMPAPAEPAPAAASIVPQPQPPVPVATQPAAEPAPVTAIAPAPVAPPVQPVPVPPAATAAAPAAEYGPVKRGETLSGITGGLGLSPEYSLDQAMLALLRANPDAFLGNNINRLKQGAVLRVPGSEELASVSSDEAQLVVREQMRQWRQERRAVAQPQATAAATASTPAAAANGTTPARQAPRRAQARLEIVPPSGSGKPSATRSGTSAGGEGSMLQQQLQQRDEEIATKAAEIGELKERVAELEKLKQQQEQLLSMKDSELAAAQQRLADSRQTANTPATATQSATQETPSSTGPVPWLLGGVGLAVLALLAWLFARRGKSSTAAPPQPASKRGFDSEALAASLRTRSGDKPVEPARAAADPAAVPAATEIDLADVPATVTPRIEAPTWHSGWSTRESSPPSTSKPAAPRFVPASDEPPAGLNPASAEHRFKLARAFLDIGDDHSAKQLLRELLDDADPAAREDAARMLRDLD